MYHVNVSKQSHMHSVCSEFGIPVKGGASVSATPVGVAVVTGSSTVHTSLLVVHFLFPSYSTRTSLWREFMLIDHSVASLDTGRICMLIQT